MIRLIGSLNSFAAFFAVSASKSTEPGSIGKRIVPSDWTGRLFFRNVSTACRMSGTVNRLARAPSFQARQSSLSTSPTENIPRLPCRRNSFAATLAA